MKKVLATILALVMALALCSVSWAVTTENCTGENCAHKAAIGTTHYDTLGDAVAAAESGAVIVLMKDTTEHVNIARDKDITIDLNGKTLSGGSNNEVAALTNYGTVVVTDSSTDKSGTIKREDVADTTGTTYYVIKNLGTMTIEQANVENNSGYLKDNPYGPMTGSSLILNGDDDAYKAVLNIKNGTFTQKNFIAVKNGSSATLNVSGGKISSDHSAIQNWCNAEITGGEIEGQLWTDAWDGCSQGKTVVGGTTKFSGEIIMEITGTCGPALTINGGEFDVTDWSIGEGVTAKPTVTGGTFSTNVSAYAGDTAVASLNGTYYVGTTDIGKAVESMGAGDTLTVVNGTVKIGNSVYTAGGNATYTVPPRYYYNSTTTTDTKKDDNKGTSPKTFDAGVGIYAVSAILSVTGMAYVGKKKF